MTLYRALSRFAVRAPLLPAATFNELGATVDNERWWADPEVEFAVTVASADLAAALTPSPAKASPAAQAALQRYLIRAATRPTPFGAFAAIGVARWSDQTDLEVNAVRRPTRTRPDMQWLTRRAEAGPHDAVYANTCAFEHAGRIYLPDPTTGGLRTAPDVSVRATPAVRQALALARGRALPVADLRHQLHTTSATPDKVTRLITQLTEQQFLLPAHLPPLLGDPLANLDRREEIAAACHEVDTAGTTALHDVRALLDGEVQVDSALPVTGGLTAKVAEEVERAVEVLFRLHPSPGWASLGRYRAAFHERYGDDIRVPLLELLDPRFGLGMPTGDGTGAGDPRADVLRELAAEAIRDGREVVLDDAAIERLPVPERVPVSVELSVFVAARHRMAIDRGDYLLMVGPNLGAQEAGRGVGRFADLIGTDAHDLLSEVVAAEAVVRGPEVVAELVYRPVQARSANVAVRPLVREYEVAVGVAPTVAPERVVHLDELSVGMVDGRFRVWWGERSLVLTAGHMLNPSAAPPVCRALLELTADGTTYLPDFDWGPMAGMPYLPRVRYGRVVLAPAQWRLTPDALRAGLDTWRKRWSVPRLVYLANGDNRLLLDLDDCSHRDQLRDAMGRHPLTLHEPLPGPDDGWLPGPRGGLITELVVPLVRRRPSTETYDRPPPLRVAADVRRPPGSDWLYVAIDGPQRVEDSLLAGSLGELADGFVRRGDADGWFFVRYADPQRQLRLRIHGDPTALTEKVLPELSQWAARAIASGARTGFALKTYEREVARYGGPETTAVCEAIACSDSTAVRDLLRTPLDRIELGLVSIADLLRSLAGAERARWADQLTGQIAAAGPRFRADKQRLRTLVQALDGGPWPDRSWQPVSEALANRRETLAPLAGSLHRFWADGTGRHAPEILAGSIVHLHANRLGLDHTAEHLTLGLLTRALRSLAAYP